jgi:peptide/nickel transport system substrate-binding protein
MTYETVGEFVDLFAAVGWEQSEVVTPPTRRDPSQPEQRAL